ncbi:MAG: phosphonate ABC transporter, permease protein PhnE [Acidobacteria bacterium]|nr:MAG: phosphonate ABC transporter, permease protein PhnE [Acidobacteriota bacterium]
MTSLRRERARRLRYKVCGWLTGSALVGWAFWWSQVDLAALVRSGPRWRDFFTRMVPPDWSVTGVVLRSTVETLMIALAGTALAVVLALPLGFLAASNVTPAWIAQPVKWLLGFIRSIPLILVAFVCVMAVGLGPFPGMLAIAFHSLGMLGKFYAEEFETADPGIVAAIEGTGASWAQTVRYGVVPQSVPQIFSFTVYRLEMNFRDSAVLGLVGAGGIGYYIQLYMRSFRFERVVVLVVVVVVVVTLLDQLTFWVRRWAR